jgi:hypothetical protein
MDMDYKWFMSSPRSTRDSLLTCHHRRRAHSSSAQVNEREEKGEGNSKPQKQKAPHAHRHSPHPSTCTSLPHIAVSAHATASLRVRIDVVFSCQQVQRCPMVVYHQCCRCCAPTVGLSLTFTHSLSLSAMVGPQGDRCAEARLKVGLFIMAFTRILIPLSSHWTRTHRQ